MSRLKAVRLNNLSMDEQIKYKTRLQAIDKILSAYEKGKIAKLATDKRYSVNAIIFVLTLKRGILRQVLEDITLVINGLSEYADYKELLDGDKSGVVKTTTHKGVNDER